MMTDREALELSVKIARRDPMRDRQLDQMLAGIANPQGGWFLEPREWEDVAEFAAGLCQSQSMNLAPWELTPSQVWDAPREGDSTFGAQSWPKAAALVKRLKAAGISRFHPDPIRALEELEKAAGQ